MKKKLYNAPKVLIKKIFLRPFLLAGSDPVRSIDTDDGEDTDVDYGGGADENIWDR